MTNDAIQMFQERVPQDADPTQIIRALEETLEQQQDFHRLFDAKLMAVRHRMQLPMTQPTSLENVPADRESDFRTAYMQAAREVGQLMIQHNQLSDAWAYFRTIGDPEPIQTAIEKIAIPREPDEDFDQLMNLALYEGAHISRGLEMLLKTHGTCNTVTAFSQLQGQMTVEERRRSAALMVRTVYKELQGTLKREIEARLPILDPSAGIAELVASREWLFADGNYHIDVSHLNSIVGFARALEKDDPELPKAIELCAYGKQLAAQLQYPGEPPFENFYEAHDHFLSAIAGQNQDAALNYFLQKLQQEPDEPDQQLIAYVLLDLAQRIERLPEILRQTLDVVSKMEDPNGFSFTGLCVELGLIDELQTAAQKNGDVLAFCQSQLQRIATN